MLSQFSKWLRNVRIRNPSWTLFFDLGQKKVWIFFRVGRVRRTTEFFFGLNKTIGQICSNKILLGKYKKWTNMRYVSESDEPIITSTKHLVNQPMYDVTVTSSHFFWTSTSGMVRCVLIWCCDVVMSYKRLSENSTCQKLLDLQQRWPSGFLTAILHFEEFYVWTNKFSFRNLET